MEFKNFFRMSIAITTVATSTLATANPSARDKLIIEHLEKLTNCAAFFTYLQVNPIVSASQTDANARQEFLENSRKAQEQALLYTSFLIDDPEQVKTAVKYKIQQINKHMPNDPKELDKVLFNTNQQCIDYLSNPLPSSPSQ
jgi:hypothetical protein